MNKSYFFISDIHLGIESDKLNNREQESVLIKFLEEIKTKAEELIIVGDLFDSWIEYKQVIPKGFYRFFTKFGELIESGVKVTYMAGNHDFWKGSFFKDEFGVEIFFSHIERIIGSRKFYIHHGDGLAYKDTGYKIMKKILRNKFSQFLYSWIHPDIGLWLAKKTSGRSRGYTDYKDYSERDGLRDFAEKKITEGFNYVVMGHMHKPEHIKFNKGEYINLGNWITSFTYGVFKGDKFELKKYYDNKDKTVLAEEKRDIVAQFIQ